VTLADSSQLATGQAVVAIGNALGQGGTPSVTQGTILGLDRSITVRGGATPESLSGLIQFDAPISPGDSGGPLVNTSAQVVGMITAAESTGRAQRVSYQGYAIAVNTAVHVVNQIRSGQSGGNIIIGPAGFLGVQVSDLDSTIAARLGLSVSSGALVVGVVPGTPAAGLGISRYAVISAINGRRIGSAADLGPAIHSHRPGEQIQVTWIDSSGTHTATVRLIAGPAA
jgi:S1-C subfamily serine protease